MALVKLAGVLVLRCSRPDKLLLSSRYNKKWCTQPAFFKTLIFSQVRNESTITKLPKRDQGKGKGIGPITWKSLFVTFAIGGVITAGVMFVRREKEMKIEKERRRVLGKASIGGHFDLIDHNGKPCSSRDFFGKWILLYFGFTHCPDICPDEIEKMVNVVETLEKNPNLAPIQPLFISVDPDRDSVPVVAGYIKEFSPKLIGLTGSQEQINKVAKSFRVYYSAGPKDVDADYIVFILGSTTQVDHTIIIYLIDPEGRFVDYYGQTRTFQQVADAIQLQMLKYESLKSKWF